MTKHSIVDTARRYKRHRFPAEVIAHAVWLYYRFPLSLRDVEGWRRLNRAQIVFRLLGFLSGLDRQGDLSPGGDGMRAKLAMVGSDELFSMKVEKVGDLAVG